jgi:polysaccharide pyruvyl transferase WcaK-like protein
VPGARLTIASLEPWVTVNTQRQMPELAGCDVVALRDAPALVKRGGFDAVFVAGGPMMAPVAQVVDLALLQQQARAQGLATGLLGCGIGPMGLPVRDLAIRELVASSDICLVRDAGSAERCSPWRPDGATMTVVPDPAMIWLETLQRQRPASPRWGFALRRFPHAEYARERSEAEASALVSRFESEVRRCVSLLLAADPAAVVVPFPMHRLAVGGDDRPYLRQLFAGCERVEPMVWRHRSPADDAADFASLSGLLGMRFHSLVFALGLGVPLTAVDYTAGGKSAALLQERGLADVLQPFDGFDGARAAEQLLAASRPAAQERADAQAVAARSARSTIGRAVAALVGQ